MRDFFGNPFQKGTYEYLSARKQQQLRFTLVFAFLVLAFVLSGLLIFKQRKNILVLPGIMMVLPMANFLVTYLALGGSKPLSAERREQVKVYEENGLALFHLMYVDEKGNRHYLDHVTVYQNAVVAFSSRIKAEEKTGVESDCIMRLRKKGISQRLKIYTDWNEYLKRLEEIAPEVPEDQVKIVEKAQELILGMCL